MNFRTIWGTIQTAHSIDFHMDEGFYVHDAASPYPARKLLYQLYKRDTYQVLVRALIYLDVGRL